MSTPTSLIRGAAGAALLVACSALAGNAHLMPMKNRLAPGVPPPPAGNTGHLVYQGGPVISNVRIYGVYWGAVDPNTIAKMPDYFNTVMSSVHLDMLNEYDTNISGGTNQIIGRGTWGGGFTINPSSATTVDDSTISSEIDSQIMGGHLPASDSNTLYVIFFPPGVTI